MKFLLLFLFPLMLSINSFGQGFSLDFKTTAVNKKISAFPDKYDLSSPLNACVSYNYLIINGRDGLYGSSSSQRIKVYMPDSTAPDMKVTEKRKNYYLNVIIKEVIVYKDSIACAISEYSESFYSIRYLSYENGKWVNAGEDAGSSVEDSRQIFAGNADMFLGYLHRIPVLAAVSNDTLSFINYLKKKGKGPKQFVMDALKTHKLVIYGEIHRRERSWNLCKSIIKDPKFALSTGTVFMELSAHKQNVIDSFLAKEKMDTELVLNIFREVQIDGWYDKGMYEFILEIWKTNKTLPAEKRIKIVAVDIPRPFSTFKTGNEQKKFFDAVGDRNAHMANTIEKYISSNKNTRNYFFIVGAGHVYKSSVPGFASASSGAEPMGTAGSLLKNKFKAGVVFTIFTHCPITENNGKLHGRIRKGLFDYSFFMTGNKPIAFNLKNNPFGKEPFDALPEISYKSNTGTFADNYDGYIFLGPLDTEPSEYILYELYSDDFVKELIRRATLDKTTIQSWFEIKEASKEAIIAKFKENEGKTRWGSLAPLRFKSAKPEQQKK